MKTINSIACASSIAIAMLSSPFVMADAAEQETTVRSTSSQVHRVSHALAGASSYQGSKNAGYKWGTQSTQDQQRSHSEWGQPTARQSGYKWGNSTLNSESTKPLYASTSGNRWGVRSYADQAGNRWGVRSYTEQAGNRWGVR